jgi:carotenoid 1,2-hydratase
MSASALQFDRPVPDGGYAWWYLDALSDDGAHGLTIILFIGSVFSPYYAWARRHGPTPALDHCAFNVALYARPGSGQPTGWTMTERGRSATALQHHRFDLGPSQAHWDGQRLHLRLCERTMPWGRNVVGDIELEPAALHDQPYALDAAGRHQWIPIAPRSRVRVRLRSPALQWEGRAYLDSNRGERPLAHDFERWDWSRAALGEQRTAVFYDAARRDGGNTQWSLCFDGGGVSPCTAPPQAGVQRSAWGLERHTRADAGSAVRVSQSLEDGPFYARAVLGTQLWGGVAEAVHETLDLRRWVRPVVQAMLPFRMPRRA